MGEDVEVRVWDSTAELRYLVLPERPYCPKPGPRRLLPFLVRIRAVPARVDHGTRAIGRRLVLDRRQTEVPARDSRSTTCRRQGYAAWACSRLPPCVHPAATIAELTYRRGGIGQQSLRVSGINPSPCHHPGAVAWANLVLISIHQGYRALRDRPTLFRPATIRVP